MEGYDLGRLGIPSLLQVSIYTLNHTWIFDLVVLGAAVFSTTSAKGWSIRRLLESGEVRTLWWDPRNDQNALFFHYGVRLNQEKTEDIQMYELATRVVWDEYKGTRYRHGLARVVGPEAVKVGRISQETADEWSRVKNSGKSYLKQSDFRVMLERPLPKIVRRYASGDTIYLRMLFAAYDSRMSTARVSREEIKRLTSDSLAAACTEEYCQYGGYLAPSAFWY